ncbi:MAG: hypothetical protein HYW25_05510 [Candidatus Aenigmarchaeota archaeon]|nr:hypothetical protein [Candidatus Aenigmarchaeota archaeon]
MPVRKYRVIGIKNENHNTKTWQITAVNGNNLEFRPGQFVLMYLLDEKGNPAGDVRPYSVSSSPLKHECLEFTIKMTPNFPAKLLDIGIGAEVGIAGPSGVFTLDESHADIVFVVGGVGVAGVSSAVRYVIDKKLPMKMTLFYSCSYAKDFIWLDEFDKMQSENFTFVPVVTRENPEGWKGETQRFSIDILRKYVETPQKAHYYLCGSPGMVSGVEEILKRIGLDRTRIKMEKWTGIGEGG